MDAQSLWKYKNLLEELKGNELFFENMHKFIIVYEVSYFLENHYYKINVTEKEEKDIYFVDYLNDDEKQELFELAYDIHIDSDLAPYQSVFKSLYDVLCNKLAEYDVEMESFTEPVFFNPESPERYVDSKRKYIDEVQLLLEELIKLENKDK